MLNGILPVLATPFTADNQVAEDDMLRIVDFVIEAGAHGVVFPGVASEFNLLSVAERQRLTGLVSERLAKRIPLVVGASAPTVADAVALTQTGLDNGAVAAMIMAPASLDAEPQPIIEFFQDISAKITIDIILQNAPPPVGAGLSVETILTIVKAVPNIRYIKEETLPSGQRITRLLGAVPDYLQGVMGGGGARYVIDEFNRGACAAMPACELTDIHVALYQAHQSQQYQQARVLYNRTLALLLFQAVFRMRMTKEVLKRRGIIEHAGMRVAMPEMDEQDHRELDTLVAEVEDLFAVQAQ